MKVEEYKRSLHITSEILDLVHKYIPPGKNQSGLIENIDNLINDLVYLRANVIAEENEKNQDKFNF